MDPVYLDHAATTPVRDEVWQAMAPFLSEHFGNPSSAHRWGRRAAAALAEARERIAHTLGVLAAEIVFTRGGTESDNLALAGRVAEMGRAGGTPKLLISAVEHPAVRDTALWMHEQGLVRLTVFPVRPDGTLDLDALESELAGGPAMVSAMWVNNETGLVLPLPEIAERVRAAGGTLHTDAVQAVGKIPVDIPGTGVDLLTVTGHKIYGPMGTGLLYTRRGVGLDPLLHGGGQERALRPGTEDVAGAVGLAEALHLAVKDLVGEAERLGGLRERLEARIGSGLSGVRVNGGLAQRAPHISSLGIADVDGQQLLAALDVEGIAVSGGSACASGATKASHVLTALYGDDDTLATVRFSLGRGTDGAIVDAVCDVFIQVVERLRSLETAA